MNIWAVLLAAGQSSRLSGQGDVPPKQFLSFEGAPLFWRSALTFSRLSALRGIVFVFPPGQVSPFLCGAGSGAVPEASYEQLLARLDAKGRLGLPWRIARGGARRQDSVLNGLALLPPECAAVLIHDSARPFASASLMARVVEALREGHEAVVPGIRVSDTIKSVDREQKVLATHEREFLRAVQTPQGFYLPSLRRAHARAVAENWEVTDDASLIERCGKAVQVVPGEEGNRKITMPQDLEFLNMPVSRCGADMLPCSGFGYDVHRYGGNRPFLLGGVPIRCDVLISAHSDGDTLLHALIDALLGCIGAGDIGSLFPDTDPSLDNISSGILLAETLERCRACGLSICHVDITIVAQTPRIAPHREAIAANLAKLMGLPRSALNVKATTEERLGFTGEKKGIKVMALVSGLKPAVPPEHA